MDESLPLRWAHPGTILVATDLQDLGRLMPFAMRQAGENGARLILLHVLVSTASFASDAAGQPYYDTAGLLEYADKALTPWCEVARRLGIPCDALVREGTAAQQISAAARQFQADRVLLGTRSRSKLSKLLIGSVAEQVLRSVNLPVITVGPEAHLLVEEDEKRVVLHATTLRETSRPSAALACQVAETQGSNLVLLHVLPPTGDLEERGATPEIDAYTTEELRQLAAESGLGCRVEVETVVVHGNPSIEILAEASERHAGLIVLGSTQRSALVNLTRDRTVYRVLAHARCPVLTLREPLGQTIEKHPEITAAYQ